MLLGSVACLLAALPFNAAASAQTLQVDADLTLQPSYSTGPSVRGGLLLWDRLAVQSGVGFQADLDRKNSDYSYRGFRVPLEVAWYFGAAKAHTLIPSLRLAGTYYQQSQGSIYYEDKGVERAYYQKSRALTGAVLGGVTYFVSEHFGITAQAGPSYRRAFPAPMPSAVPQPDFAKHTIFAEYRVGLMFRS